LFSFAQLCDTDPGLIELFVDGKEDRLSDLGRLDGLGLGEGSVVFMLQHAGWCWTAHGQGITLTGLMATVTADDDHCWLVAGGEPMTEGRHYWEVEICKFGENEQDLPGSCMVGAVPPDNHHYTDGAYLIDATDGSLWGNSKISADTQGGFAQGDRVGVLLDLDAGWLRFYRNNKRCGPGFATGVCGPLVRAAVLFGLGGALAVLPCAVAPEGAGDTGELWENPREGGG